MKINYEWDEGYNGPRGNVGFTMKFDKEKAKEIITKLINENKDIDYVEVGLDGDWEINRDILFTSNSFQEVDFYDNSIWATPIMIVYYNDTEDTECYEVWNKVKKKSF